MKHFLRLMIILLSVGSMQAQKVKLDGSKLYIKKELPTAEASDSIVTVGSNGKVRQIAKSVLLSGAGSTPLASNGVGIDLVSSDIILGGNLTNNTSISGVSLYDLSIQDMDRFTIAGGDKVNLAGNSFNATFQDDIYLYTDSDLRSYSTGIAIETVGTGHIKSDYGGIGLAQEGIGSDRYNNLYTTVVSGSKPWRYSSIDENTGLETPITITDDRDITHKKYVDETVAGVDVSNFVKKTGDNIAGSLVIDTDATTTGIASSALAVKKNHITGGTAVNTFFDTSVNITEDLSVGNTFHGIVSRTDYKSDFDATSTGGVFGSNFIGRHSGAGSIGYAYGIRAEAENNGSGSTDFLMPIVALAEITGTGSSYIQYARSNSIDLDNPNATLDYGQCSHPSLMLKQGTLALGGHVMFLDIDVDAANLGTTLNVNGEVSYIQGGGGTDVQALKTHLSDKGEKLRFIYNQGDIESDFNGLININKTVAEIEAGTGITVPNVDWVNASIPTYIAGNNVTIDYTNPIAPIINSLTSSISVGGWEVGTGNQSIQQTNSSAPNDASGRYAIATGWGSVGSGDFSMAMGFGLVSPSGLETSFGNYATLYTPTCNDCTDDSDRLFTIGKGNSQQNRSDAFTILKSGQTGIGIDNFETNTTGEKLQVNGKIKATDINFTGLPTSATGLSTGDVWNNNGVLNIIL